MYRLRWGDLWVPNTRIVRSGLPLGEVELTISGTVPEGATPPGESETPSLFI